MGRFAPEMLGAGKHSGAADLGGGIVYSSADGELQIGRSLSGDGNGPGQLAFGAAEAIDGHHAHVRGAPAKAVSHGERAAPIIGEVSGGGEAYRSLGIARSGGVRR